MFAEAAEGRGYTQAAAAILFVASFIKLLTKTMGKANSGGLSGPVIHARAERAVAWGTQIFTQKLT